VAVALVIFGGRGHRQQPIFALKYVGATVHSRCQRPDSTELASQVFMMVMKGSDHQSLQGQSPERILEVITAVLPKYCQRHRQRWILVEAMESMIASESHKRRVWMPVDIPATVS
jgi:hypothetical protein